MSRIGKIPVALPDGVSAVAADGLITVKGPKGVLSQRFPEGISVEQKGKSLVFLRESEERKVRANHGLMRALVANMVNGVSKGFERKLEIRGVGYKAEKKGRELTFTLGYSHQIIYPIPEGIDIDVGKAGDLTVKGIDKQQVGQVAAVIRAFRAPDSYKGKGIRYMGENVRIKAGKSAN